MTLQTGPLGAGTTAREGVAHSRASAGRAPRPSSRKPRWRRGLVAGTLGAWLGLPCPEAPSAFFKWMARGSTVCFL